MFRCSIDIFKEQKEQVISKEIMLFISRVKTHTNGKYSVLINAITYLNQDL